MVTNVFLNDKCKGYPFITCQTFSNQHTFQGFFAQKKAHTVMPNYEQEGLVGHGRELGLEY